MTSSVLFRLRAYLQAVHRMTPEEAERFSKTLLAWMAAEMVPPAAFGRLVARMGAELRDEAILGARGEEASKVARVHRVSRAWVFRVWKKAAR